MLAQEYIDKQKKVYAETVDVAEFLLKLYPDLEIVEDRWRNKRYISKKVNREAVDYHTWHSCGCCTDSPLYFNPYIKHGEKTFVYGKPLNMVIGEKVPYKAFTDRLYDNWKDTLRGYGVNEQLIEKFEKDKSWLFEENDND